MLPDEVKTPLDYLEYLLTINQIPEEMKVKFRSILKGPKIDIYHGDRPACSDGCCHEEYISIEVNGEEVFEMDGHAIHNQEFQNQIKEVLTKVLPLAKVELI